MSLVLGLVKAMEENGSSKQLWRDPSYISSRILAVLQKHNGLTISDVSRILGIHYTTASKYLAVMEAEQKVTHRRIGMAKLFVANGVNGVVG